MAPGRIWLVSTLNYADGDSLFFKYEKGLIKLQNAPNADSVKVMDYIETFNYFYVDQFLPPNHEAIQLFDEFIPAGNITIQALNEQQHLSMQFFTHS